MAELHTLARPYAKAVFALAVESGALKQWSETLKPLAAAFSDPQIAHLIGQPALTREQLANQLDQALGSVLDQAARNFLRVLTINGRLSLLPAVAAEFEAMREEIERRIEVEITTAVVVEAAQQQLLVAAVAKKLAREVDVSWKVDDALIGGAMVRAGDLVIDGSVAGELDRLRHALAA
jgi:F-type H+-transporting ATPase subunit delta